MRTVVAVSARGNIEGTANTRMEKHLWACMHRVATMHEALGWHSIQGTREPTKNGPVVSSSENQAVAGELLEVVG